jgi:uncharacterized protein YecA (UPF0149 family)
VDSQREAYDAIGVPMARLQDEAVAFFFSLVPTHAAPQQERPVADASRMQLLSASTAPQAAEAAQAAPSAAGAAPVGKAAAGAAARQATQGTVVKGDRPGRNDPCPCGSGRKYKKCHGA